MKYNLKKFVMTVFFFLFLPMIGILAFYNVYSLKLLNKNIAKSNKQTIYIYEQPITQELVELKYYMANQMANDTDYLRFNYSMNQLEGYMCAQNIRESYLRFMESGNRIIGGMFFYGKKNDIFRSAYNTKIRYTYKEKLEIEETVKNMMLVEDIERLGWINVEIAGYHFLVRILKNNKVFTCSLVDFTLIQKPQDNKNNRQDGVIVFLDDSGNVLYGKDYLNEMGINKIEFKGNYFITRDSKYMIVQHALGEAGIKTVYITKYNGVWNYMDITQLILLFFSILVLIMLPFIYLLLRNNLFRPLEKLTGTIEEIKEGDIDSKMDIDYGAEEFQKVSIAFNEMIEQIKSLRIETYEKEMQIKNAQLQYLQIQIRPHFYLNCLKNFYALAEQKDYVKIQDMTIALSDYLRRTFQNNNTFIKIKDELEHVRNYIQLQQMSLSHPPQCIINVDSKLMENEILPLSILTFVENSVKHGCVEERKLIITIKITELVTEEEKFLCITILDNGQGFTEEELQNLNGTSSKNVENKVGIHNVVERVRIVYGSKSMILFSNSNGACVEFYLFSGRRVKQN